MARTARFNARFEEKDLNRWKRMVGKEGLTAVVEKLLNKKYPAPKRKSDKAVQGL